MVKCKKCKSVVGFNFDDVIDGEVIEPKQSSMKSSMVGLCLECYEKKEVSQ